MGGVPVLLMIALTGITYGWQPDKSGGVAYIIQIPPDVYFVDRLPVSVELFDVLTIVAASVAVALVATIYPARQAAGLEVVDAIRHE